MERRWPLGLALLLLLCAPLSPGARAEEGTEPRPLPFPADGQQPARAGIPEEALFPRAPLLLPGFSRVAGRSIGQANLWSLTPDSCPRDQSPLPCWPALFAAGGEGVPDHSQEAALQLQHHGTLHVPTPDFAALRSLRRKASFCQPNRNTTNPPMVEGLELTGLPGVGVQPYT